MIETAIGLVVAGFLATLGFGLVTGRIAWRQQGCCCPADPADDARMRDSYGHADASCSAGPASR
jgi:hypothetical protein